MKPKGFRNVPGMRAARRRRAAALVADNADPFASPSASASGLGRAGAAYLEWLAVRGYAQGTRESAREALNWFAAWCEECGLAEPGDITRPGSNAEQQVVDERIVGHAPKSLSDTDAAGALRSDQRVFRRQGTLRNKSLRS